MILKEYVTRYGSVEAGLKSYVGAADMQNDGGYGIKVLSEYENLKEVATGKNVSIFTTALIKPRPLAPATAQINQPVKPNSVADVAVASNAASAKPPVTAAEVAAL